MQKKPSVLSLVISGIVTLLTAFLIFWFQLPPIHVRSPQFWMFVLEILATALVVFSLGSIIDKLKNIKTSPAGIFEVVDETRHFSLKTMKKTWHFFVIVIMIAIVVLLSIGGIFSAEIFNAAAYRDIITIDNGDFAENIDELPIDRIPVVDRDTASRLGQRQLGNIPDLVSQFEISEDYTQVNVGGKQMRVTPLIYADFFKWIGNQSQGIPAYITVDMVTQDTALVRLDSDKCIRYSESEYFMRNINRYLRFQYPTEIFGEVLFEIDDDGTPYWVAPCKHYTIGIWGGIDVKGAILVNAVTGESKYYANSEVPQWVDRVFDANDIITQLNWNGKYQEGFLNAYFGQRNVRLATEGYSYIAQDDDVFMYTGMTSATADESNIGFVLVNMRTKATTFYTVPGAEEYSAMDSAEGQVQHLGYKATFPLLLNISERPTYFMSLKDASGLVKMYAFVDVQQYQIVGTGDTVEKAKADYLAKLKTDSEVKIEQTTATFSGTITDIGSAVVDSSTQYYIRIDSDDRIFTAAIAVSPELPFAVVGDTVTLEAVAPSDDQTIIEVTAVTFEAVTPDDKPVEEKPVDDTAENDETQPATATAAE